MVRRFEIYWVNLDPTVGCEINKVRPCVIISPDELNQNLSTVIVAPLISGTARKRTSSRLRRTNDRSVLLVQEDHEDDENAEIEDCEQSPSTLRNYPSRIALKFNGKKGQIVLDQIRTVDKSRLIEKAASVPSSSAKKIIDLLLEIFS